MENTNSKSGKYGDSSQSREYKKLNWKMQKSSGKYKKSKWKSGKYKWKMKNT